jgi:Sister chromatid cohesion C-terminus
MSIVLHVDFSSFSHFQSFPVIVALGTSPNAIISARAGALHAILHTKHSSLLNTRYIVGARASFEYQKKLSQGLVEGRLTILVNEKEVDVLVMIHRLSSVPRSQCPASGLVFPCT